MAHDVRFSVPHRPLGKVDVVFVIRRKGKKFGELRISKGALEWIPRNKKKYGTKFSWFQFDKLAATNGDWAMR
jgi:hypothetical protein